MSSAVARRYAQALYAEARRKNDVERVDDDVQLLRDTLGASGELARFLEHPFVTEEKKLAVLDRLFGAHVNGLTKDWLALLVEKDREMRLPDILAAYAEQRDARLGIVEAHVRVATPLAPAEVDALRDRLEARIGKKVRIRMDIDATLIGGLVVRMGDLVYDQSVRHKLDELRKDLLAASAISLN